MKNIIMMWNPAPFWFPISFAVRKKYPQKNTIQKSSWNVAIFTIVRWPFPPQRLPSTRVKMSKHVVKTTYTGFCAFWYRQAIFESKWDMLSSFVECRTRIREVWDTYIFVVVNFDALVQASDFRIDRRQVAFSVETRIRAHVYAKPIL